jgi:hypothetical protein
MARPSARQRDTVTGVDNAVEQVTLDGIPKEQELATSKGANEVHALVQYLADQPLADVPRLVLDALGELLGRDECRHQKAPRHVERSVHASLQATFEACQRLL